MTATDIIQALEDGSIYNREPEEWREMLRIAAQAKASNPNYAHRITQASEIIRYLLALHEHRLSSAEIRDQHEANYGLGTRTLRWTVIAAVAALIAAVAAIGSLLAQVLSR